MRVSFIITVLILEMQRSVLVITGGLISQLFIGKMYGEN